MTRLAWVTVVSTVLAGCAVGPNFQQPQPPSVSRYTSERLETSQAGVNATSSPQRFVSGLDVQAEWWKVFRSPSLNTLVEESLKKNPTIDAAVAAIRVAQENVRAQQGRFFPTVTGNASPTYQQVAHPTSSPLSSGANVFGLHTAQVSVGYVFDVWGQNRRAVEALQATAEFQRFQLEAAYLTLASNVVAAAIQEASLRSQIEATRELIAISRRILGTLRRQLEAGAITRIDVAAQESQLAQTEATLPPLEKQLAQQRDLLAALAGRFPSEPPAQRFSLASLALPRRLPVSLPSRLIEQRPDIRSAEQQLRVAGAQIGVATANLLPQLSITATGGYTSTSLASLFSPTNFFGSLVGNAVQPIFDGFALWSLKRAAEASFDQAAAQYRSTVIGALQNVADSLRAIQADARAVAAATRFQTAAKLSLDLTQKQLEVGQVSILLLLNAQQGYLQARLALIQARALQLTDTAALFQSLGGGWWNRPDSQLREPVPSPLHIVPIPPPPAPGRPPDVQAAVVAPAPAGTN
ncbi:MAG: efflux transporter outer membrane subunit [Phreatobacter sp.]